MTPLRARFFCPFTPPRHASLHLPANAARLTASPALQRAASASPPFSLAALFVSPSPRFPPHFLPFH
jgi:hypothetical protein